jgi:hypothetical protein
LLLDLIQWGCVSAQIPAARPRATPVPPATTIAPPAQAPAQTLQGLPAPQNRSAEQIEMARHFMINTLNTMFGGSRLTLVKRIFSAPGAAELREIYPDWERAMAESRIGARRLPEWREKLFAVL